MSRPTPLLSFESQSTPKPARYSPSEEEDSPAQGWIRYLPVCFLVVLILAPHPSLLIVLVHYHLETLHSPLKFTIHLIITYILTFFAFSSLIICIVRDPGPVNVNETDQDADDAMDLTQALMSASREEEDDLSAPGKFCRKCWAPKPERAHHCGTCGRCVLKMDHHCVWLASKCIGHRTYPAFVHLLCSVTLLAIYIAVICTSALLFAFQNPMEIDETTPIHELFLSFAGIIFSIVVGSFLLYHSYLVTSYRTNQTTLESLSPFLLLRHLPSASAAINGNPGPGSLDEDRMSYAQRRVVKDAHGQIRIYDIGWRRNWAQVFGWDRKWGWVYRLVCGGGGKGDGRTFPRNPRSDEMLVRLAAELEAIDKDR